MKLGFISVLYIDDNRGWSPEFFVTAMNKVLQDKDLDYFLMEETFQIVIKRRFLL